MAAHPVWVSVEEKLPPNNLPILLWGSRLVAGEDYPLPGQRCACHGQWVLDTDPCDAAGDFATACYTERMLGTVTHWLDWRLGLPGASSERNHDDPR